jgi:hypothetical protein
MPSVVAQTVKPGQSIGDIFPAVGSSRAAVTGLDGSFRRENLRLQSIHGRLRRVRA